MENRKKMPLAGRIFIALIAGVILGLLMQDHVEAAEHYIKPFGTIFLNLVKFIVVPIVLFSIMSGILSMRDIRKLGSIGVKTLVYYLSTTAFAVAMAAIVIIKHLYQKSCYITDYVTAFNIIFLMLQQFFCSVLRRRSLF